MNAFRVTILFFLLLPFAVAAEKDKTNYLFEVRQWDEIVLTDGTVLRGKVYPQDDGSFKFVDLANRARTILKEEIREVRYKSTAEQELTRLADLYKDDPHMLHRTCVEATTRFNLAARVIPILEQATAAHKDGDLILLLGSLYLDAGDPQKALHMGEEAVSSAPQRPRSYMLRGQALLALERMAEAEKDLVKAYQSGPQDEEIALAYANFLLLTDRPDEAKKLFTEETTKDPRNFAAWNGQGMVQLRLGEFSKAEMSFLQALSINAEFKPARIGLAVTKLMEKQYDDAYQECVGVLNLDTKSAEAFAVEGFAKMLNGDPESLAKAQDKFDDSLKERPNQPRVILAYAALLGRMARQEEIKDQKGSTATGQLRAAANAKYADVLATDAADSFIQYFIGERRFKEAEEARANKDRTAAEIGYKKAEEAFQRVVKLAPHYAPAYGALGAAQLQLQKWEDARKAFNKASEFDPNTAEYYSGQGLALLKNTARIDEASRLFSKARELDAHNVAALCGLGYIENYASHKEGALDFFQQALAADGSCTYAVDALQRIYKQESMDLEYVTFKNQAELPTGWRFRSGASTKCGFMDNRVVFTGVQGSATSSKIELYKDIPKADEFVRLEADLQINPTSAVSFGLRVSSGGGALTTFELEFGKDETNEIKVRFKDYGGQPPLWSPLGKTEWPADGKVRLGVHTDDLKTGAFTLWVNGKARAKVDLKLQKPTRLTVGTFLQAPPREVINASVDNIVLVRRGVFVKEDESNSGIQLIDKSPAPATDGKAGDKGKTP